MVINANTKIGTIIKHNPAALDAIVNISPKFERLRNPVLRKLMAGRTSVSMACKMGGCNTDDFLTRLRPLGFEIDVMAPVVLEEKSSIPGFLKSLEANQMVLLDVRPIISSGKDPLQIILEKIETLQPKQTLKIINTFEPTPLMILLRKQGFESYADVINPDRVETYFYRQTMPEDKTQDVQSSVSISNWDEIIAGFKDKIQTIDVRLLEMPLPMLTILEALDDISPGKALYVHHKRIPVFLLPELAQRKLEYRIKEISDSEVHLLIYKA